MKTEEIDIRQVKAAICQKCSGWVMVSCFPDCEKRPESRREFVKCINDGDEITVLLLTEWNASAQRKVMCAGHKKTKAKKQPGLFS